MNYKTFNKFCGALPSTTYIIQWGDSHVWKVGGKVFAIGGWEYSNSPAFTFKASASDFLFLSDEPGYRPAPYFASRGMKWIQIHDMSLVDDVDLKYYLNRSYQIVVCGLTQKKREKLGIDIKKFGSTKIL